MKLKQLIAKAKKIQAALDALSKRLDEAEDDADRKIVEDAIAEKEAEFAKIEQEVATLRAKAAREKLIEDLEGMNAPDRKGAKASTPAEPKDHVRAELEHVDAFVRTLQGRPPRDSEAKMRMVLPDPDGAFSHLAGKARTARMPLSMAAKILGDWYAGAYGNCAPSLAKDLNSTNDSALIAPEFKPVLQMLPAEPANIFPRTTLVPTKGGTVDWPTLVQTDPPSGNEYGGVTVSWISEGATKPKTEPTFGEISITAHEVAARTVLNDRFIKRSAIGLMELLRVLFTGAIRDALDTAILNGSGTGQPLGVIQDSIRTVTRQTAGSVTYRDLVRLKRAILPHHRQNIMFAMNDDVGQTLEETLDSQGRPLYTASTAAGPYDRLVGLPFLENLRQPAVGTQGDIVCGDWSQYVTVLEQDIVIAASEHEQFSENKTVVKAFMAIGGRAVQTRAFSMLADASS